MPSNATNSTEPASKRRKVSIPTAGVIDTTQAFDGDLVLKVGKDNKFKLIRVHSACLKMASVVFRVMLGPNFIEGSNTYTAENPLSLEDDDEAMLTLCRLLHHQCTSESSILLNEFVALVTVADKYECLGMVRPWFIAAISPYLASSDTIPRFGSGFQVIGLGDAMCVAFALNDAPMFWRLSKDFIAVMDTRNIGENINEDLLEIMPQGLSGKYSSIYICIKTHSAKMPSASSNYASAKDLSKHSKHMKRSN